MEISRRQLLQGGLAGTGLLVLGACGGSKAAQPTVNTAGSGASVPSATGGTAQILLSGGGSRLVLDPATQVNEPDAIVNGLLYDGLFRLHDDWSVEPQLALEYDVDPTFTTWTIPLRRDVVFHDGRPFTAADAVFSARRVLDEALGSAVYARLAPELSPNGIEALDDHTLRITLDRPDSFLPVALAARHLKIVPDGTTDFDAAIGTGPFRLERLDQALLAFETVRHTDNWRSSPPRLDGVRGSLSNDQQTLIQSVTNGNYDFGGFIDPSAAASLNLERSQLYRHAEFLFNNIVLDPTVPPFDDERVRTAFKLALDRAKILDVAYQGYGSVTYDTPVRASDQYFPESLTTPRDVETARRLLADAGYADGIDVTMHTAPAGAGMVDFAVVAAEGLREAGIRVNIQQDPADTYFDVIWLQEPVYVSTWVARHPLDAMSVMFKSDAPWNEPRFASAEFDALLEKASLAGTADEQRASLRDAQLILAEQSGFVCPAWFDELYVAKPTLRGVSFNATDLVAFDEASLQS